MVFCRYFMFLYLYHLFYLFVFLFTSCLRSLLLLCIRVSGILSPTKSSFVKSSISSFITWSDMFNLSLSLYMKFVSVIVIVIAIMVTFTSLLFPSGWRGSLSSSLAHIPSSKQFVSSLVQGAKGLLCNSLAGWGDPLSHSQFWLCHSNQKSAGKKISHFTFYSE